jgi:hypothetical protein
MSNLIVSSVIFRQRSEGWPCESHSLPSLNREAAERVDGEALFDGLNKADIYELHAKGVLEGDEYPAFGHETRHAAARRWFLKHHRSQAVEETENLVFRLGGQMQDCWLGTTPFDLVTAFSLAIASLASTEDVRSLPLGTAARVASAANLTLMGHTDHDASNAFDGCVFDSSERAPAGIAGFLWFVRRAQGCFPYGRHGARR